MDTNDNHSVATSEIAEYSFAESQDNARVLAANSHSPNTLRNYQTDWRHFHGWCQQAVAESPRICALPTNDETLATYVGHEIQTRPKTLQRRFSAIRFVHLRAGHPSPFDTATGFHAAFQGHKRHWAGLDPSPKQAICTEKCIKTMADVWKDDSDLLAARNRALLLVGFDAALRRSELVEIDIEHLLNTDTGIDIYLPKSKGDQFGDGDSVPIGSRESAYCSTSALQQWLALSGISDGPVFRSFQRRGQINSLTDKRLSAQSVYHLIKKTAEHARMSGNYGPHSLRRGFINSAVEARASIQSIQTHVRHQRADTTMKYLQKFDQRRLNPGALLLNQ